MYVDESSLVERAETDKKVTALFVIQSNMENLLCKKSSRFPCLVIETVAALDKPLDQSATKNYRERFAGYLS